MTATAALELISVAVRFGRLQPTLDDVDLTLPAGTIVGVAGPNGSGKTTLLRVMSRVLRAARGRVLVEGRDIQDFSRAELARVVAVVPQQTQTVFPFTAMELVLMGRYAHGYGALLDPPQSVDAARLALRDVDGLGLADRSIVEMSGGERQRVLLARALAQRSRILLLDEPTAHLDPPHQRLLAGLLRRLRRDTGTTIVLVTHDLNLVSELADRAVLLAGGRVVATGPTAEVLRPEPLEAAYGCRMWIGTNERTGRPFVHLH